MNKQKITLGLLIVALIASGLNARDFVLPFGSPDRMRFDRVGFEAGLQNLSVSRIVQDSYGFLWFATQNGLHRFDGKSFRIFENNPYDQGTLSHNLVQTLYVDGNTLWIGTYQGLNAMDLSTYRIKRYEPDTDNPQSISHPVVTSIYRDSGKRLWAGTLDGLNLLDEARGTFTRIPAEPGVPGKLQDKIIRSIMEDSQGNLWVGTGGGLHRYNSTNGSFTVYRTEQGLGANSVMCLANDSKGRLWAGCWGGGLSLYHPDTDTFENFALPDNRLYCLFAKPDGNILAGTWGGGLFEVTPAGDTPEGSGKKAPPPRIETYVNDRSDPRSLSNNTVYSLMTDSTGMLWIGTNGGGANRFNPRHLQFRNYTAGNDEKDVLPPGRTMYLERESDTTILASIYNSGLAEINTATGECRLYSRDDPNAWIPDNIINDILTDRKGRTWIATNDGIAIRGTGETQFKPFDKYLSGKHTLPDHIFYALFEDREGSIWIGTYSHGIIQWNPDRNIWNQYNTRSGEGHSLSSDLVSDIQEDLHGGIWIGTYGGLNRLNPRDGTIKSWFHDTNDTTSISSNSIRQILPDSQDRIWIGTIGGGVNLFDRKTETFSHILKEDGLSNNSIAGMVEYPRGQFWIATREGLTHYDPDNAAFTRYGMNDGLVSHDFTCNLITNPDGSFTLGHAQGLTVMSGMVNTSQNNRAQLAITATRIGTTGSTAAPVLNDCTHDLSSMNLDWTQNQIEFEFRYLEFGAPGAHRYSWKLEGFDKEWSTPRNITSALYANLGPGTYEFKVRASNQINDPEPATASLTITIPWHPLAHPLAIVLYATTGMVLLLLFLRHYLKLRRIAKAARL